MSEETLFDRVLQVPQNEREAFLNRECTGDPVLRKRMLDLLAADERAREQDATRSFDKSANAAGSTDTATAQANDEQPETILAGKYRLTERIGEGGMGSVWVAHQSEPVKRKVAVKLIKAGMDSKQVLARFEAERQALAVMDHPNIAKVLDGGLHDGRPFFVMELVKGIPITEYCDARKLTPKERLELFVPVCQAIQHAHQKGIIHRDIKPSNVLIALYDDKPVPKVIDFGIAKATGGTLTEHTIETAFGGVVGTPQYMSPEQASLNNLDIDTRSDVYSLGVLLYELLTGSPPFAKKELEKKGFLEILRVVREEEPPRPSTKLSTADALPTLSANRGTEPKKLTGILRNELDWIVMKALEKDRARRYETANGFAADVNRYLNGEIVQAHPPSIGYRIKKFARRNTNAVMMAGLILLGLLAGMVVELRASNRVRVALIEEMRARMDAEEQKANALRSAEREAEERKKADAARIEVQAKVAETRAVLKFFEEKVFSAAKPIGERGALGKDVTLRAAITASLPALAKEFSDKPLVEAYLRNSVGLTFHSLGDSTTAAGQLERARAIYAEQNSPDHINTLSCTHNLAMCYEFLGRRQEALKLNEEVLAARRRVLPPDHPFTLLSMHAVFLGYGSAGRYDDALRLNEELLSIYRRLYGQDDPRTLDQLHNRARLYSSTNRVKEAVALKQETLAAIKRVRPNGHVLTFLIMATLADDYEELNRHADALTLREQVLAAYRQVYPADHTRLLLALVRVSRSLDRLGRATEALPDIDAALVAVAGREADPEVAPSIASLRMMVCKTRNDPAGCRAAAEMWEKLNRPYFHGLYDTACFRAVAAGAYAKANQPAESIADADKAMAWLHKAVQAGYKDVAHMKKDTDLDTLRDREDFKKLLADLEAMAGKK